MRVPIYLTPVQLDTQDIETLGQIRSQQGSTFLARSVLLARRGPAGIYLWSRQSAQTYLLDWETVRELLQEEEQVSACGIMPEKQEAS